MEGGQQQQLSLAYLDQPGPVWSRLVWWTHVWTMKSVNLIQQQQNKQQLWLRLPDKTNLSLYVHISAAAVWEHTHTMFRPDPALRCLYTAVLDQV